MRSLRTHTMRWNPRGVFGGRGAVFAVALLLSAACDESPQAPLRVDVPFVAGEGFQEGQLAANWSLLDINGEPVNLHDFAGRVIFFESGAQW